MTAVLDALGPDPALATVRSAVEALDDDVWVVGGTVRDALLGRPLRDVDLAVDGDAERVARAVARALRGPVFRLSERFGAWRALDRSRRFACDVSPLQGETLLEDLARRDFTANAMAIGLRDGGLVDPSGGRHDLEAGVLRVLGPDAYAADPLRPLRMARLATELALAPDPETERLTAAAAPRVTAASPERVWAELRRLVVAERALAGLELAGRLGLVAAVLPELEALRGMGQSHFHHADVHSHTLEVLRQTVELERDPAAVADPRLTGNATASLSGDQATALAAVLDAPLGDELTRGQALRFAALFHDVGKPATRAVRPDGRPTFLGHDMTGAAIVGEICRRLRTGERVRSFLQAVTRHHLVLGFLVHERPLSRRAIYRYLRKTEPVEVEVTLFSCADRLATRGRDSPLAIAAHLELAACLLGEALRWRAEGPPRAPLRGDELAEALGLAPGPEIGALLRELEEAAFAGEVSARGEALELARRVRQNSPR